MEIRLEIPDNVQVGVVNEVLNFASSRGLAARFHENQTVRHEPTPGVLTLVPPPSEKKFGRGPDKHRRAPAIPRNAVLVRTSKRVDLPVGTHIYFVQSAFDALSNVQTKVTRGDAEDEAVKEYKITEEQARNAMSHLLRIYGTLRAEYAQAS